MVVCLVHLVCFVHLVSLVQPNKQDKPDEPDEQDMPADFFSILLETLLLTPRPVNRLYRAFVRAILLTMAQTSEKKLYIPSHHTQ